MVKISVVTTLYKSEQYINEFIKRTKKVLLKNKFNDYEIIFVNDGSPDNSSKVLNQICENDDKIVFIDLSRNFGHHKALMTGLKYSKGDLIYLLNSDLEEEPEWFDIFYNEIVRKKNDLVYGFQNHRSGNIFNRFFGNMYYRLISYFLDVNHPQNSTTARLMTRKYLESFLKHKEKQFVISGLFALTGYNQIGIEVHRKLTSPTTYTFQKKSLIMLHMLTSMSSKPLIVIFVLGTIITLISSMIIIYLLISKLFFSGYYEGWVSIIMTILFMGGLIIMMQGIIGLYIASINEEVKNRPLTIIKSIKNKK